MTEDTFVVEVKRSGETNLTLRAIFSEDDTSDENPVEPLLKTRQDRFRRLAQKWTSTAISFFEVVPLLNEIGYAYADVNTEQQTLRALEELNVGKESEEKDKVTIDRYRVPLSEAIRISKEIEKSNIILQSAGIMHRAALTALVAEYEAFVKELLRLALDLQPNVFAGDKIQLSLSDIEEAETLEALRDRFISKKLEDALINSSHTEVLKWIGDKFSVNLISDASLLSEFIEVCQRRHIVMHAGGRANARYKRVCIEAGCKAGDMLDEGEVVVVSRAYLRRATARVYQIGYFTLHLIWQKLTRDFRTSDQVNLETSHSFLERDLTKMARRVAEFPLNRKGNSPDNHMTSYLALNIAQSWRFAPDLSEEDRIKFMDGALKNFDWSMPSPIVKLALACLREEYDEIDNLVYAAVNYGDPQLTYSEISTWSIFRYARGHSKFMEGVTRSFPNLLPRRIGPPEESEVSGGGADVEVSEDGCLGEV